jgi:predicted DNA-binding protein
MNPPPEPQPRQRRYSVRRQTRLDTETYTKLEELARTFHRKRAAVLRFVMGWGLTQTQGWTVDRIIPASVHLVPLLVEPAMLQQVQAAANAHGADVAAWERHAMRQVTPEDFPASWRLGETTRRSHESGYYHRKFGLQLAAVTSHKLETLTHTFDRPAAEVIRQLIRQARLEEFPRSWHLAAHAQRQRETRVGEGNR